MQVLVLQVGMSPSMKVFSLFANSLRCNPHLHYKIFCPHQQLYGVPYRKWYTQIEDGELLKDPLKYRRLVGRLIYILHGYSA